MARADDWLRSTPLAHRGLHGEDLGAENSIDAFESAASRGYGIELDVHVSSDLVPLVSHDEDVEFEGRTFSIAETSTAQMAAMDVRLPGLDETFGVVSDRVPILVEIKPGSWQMDHCQNVADVVSRHDAAFAIQSFDENIVAWFRSHRPHWLRGQLFELSPGTGVRLLTETVAALRSVVRSRPNFIAVNVDARHHPVVTLWKRLGLGPVLCWTVTDESTYSSCLAGGYNTIFENFSPAV